MTTKPYVSKIRGFLFALIIVVMLIVLMAQTKTDSKNLSVAVTQEVVVSANNIVMKLIDAHTEGSNGYRVEVCYNLPDQRDWLLAYPSLSSDTTLSAADIKVHPAEEGTMYWKYDTNGKLVQRCQYLLFNLNVPSRKESLSLRIGHLYAREPEQSDYCLETSQKMVERNYSVMIDCMEVDGLEGLVYVKFPTELLSMDPVFKNIFKDVKWDFYDGPWSFTFPVNPP